ncbi:MAG: protein YgfX [Burkholderiaceae bacterium]|nr:protein YgfX [Burkholderiaceae bacterium]
MSIAISVIVRPSRLLFMLSLTMCACIAAVGMLVGFCLAGNFSFVVRLVIASLNFVFAFFALFHISRKRKTFRIDISGIGQIRMRQYESAHPEFVTEWETVRLAGASILWPGLMFLRLEAGGGQATLVPVLPDSVSADEFHGLAVACRWIAMRSERQEEMT